MKQTSRFEKASLKHIQSNLMLTDIGLSQFIFVCTMKLFCARSVAMIKQESALKRSSHY